LVGLQRVVWWGFAGLELAGFLGVSIVKDAPAGSKDPFVAEVTELFCDRARFLRLPLKTAKPVGSVGRCLDLEDW
jgi:hypothetical protein